MFDDTLPQVLPIVFIIKCGIGTNLLRFNMSFVRHASSWCLFFDPHLTTHHLHISVDQEE